MSTENQYYMKKDVYFEPLINRWYAWAYLMPPAQAARYTTDTHLRLMKSFVKNAKLHVIANQQLVGGEFLNCTEEQVTEIKDLISETELNCAELIDLSEAIVELDELLRGHVSNESIEYLYEKIPDALKGYVEIVLDIEHRPSYRLLESLLYKSKYYRTSLQSVSFGILSRVKERSFALSTPRIADENHLQVALPFNSPKLKTLLASRDIPVTMEQIESIFDGLKCEGGLEYMDLFTTESPRSSNSKFENEMKIEYIGHAGFLIQTRETAILIDPVIASYNENDSPAMLDYSQLPEQIDFICLTHTHLDHTQLESLLQLRHKTNKILVPKSNSGFLVDPSLKMMLQQLDFEAIELEDLDTIPIPEGEITALPFLGEHGDLNIRSKSAWLIEIQGKKMFFGADSSCLDKNMYKHLHGVIGDLDLLAIGMECVGAPYTWMYGALHSKKVEKRVKESRRLNGADSRQAIDMVEIFSPDHVYVYALGAEPCYKYFMGVDYDETSKQITESSEFIRLCSEQGLNAKTLIGSQEVVV